MDYSWPFATSLKQDVDLWDRVLANENEYRRQLVDEVVGTALPENENANALG